MAEQSYQSHGKFDPLFHFTIVPLSVGLAIWSAVSLFYHPDQLHTVVLLLAVVLFLAIFKTRLYALRNQDRLIRLEEQTRLHRLMPNEPTLVDSLTVDQFIGLRFACDEEAPEIARRAVRENLDRKAIKQAIARWRADHHRI